VVALDPKPPHAGHLSRSLSSSWLLRCFDLYSERVVFLLESIPAREEYFKRFRVGDPLYMTYPVEPSLLEFICYLKQGRIRDFLLQLHNALEYGAMNRFPELTLEYARQHPLDILGREISQRDIDGYHKYRGEPMAPEPTGRSWDGTVKGFKETNKPL